MRAITFNELRKIKDSLPDGSMHRIADELGLNVDTVRNFFGGQNFKEGKSVGIHLEPGPDGGLVMIDDTTVSVKLTMPSTAVMGIDYTYQSGEQVTEIYVDGELYVAPTVTFDYDFSQRHILIVGRDCGVNESIEIRFENAEALDGFYGLAFSNIG